MRAPNFVIVMADQLAPHFTGCYGHSIVQTPNLDRLAERGCRFDAAYTATPLCAPARYSLMSGQLPFRIRAYDNASEFSSSVPTFAHYLRRMEYHVCLSGKMHFIGPDQLHGFTERLTTDIYPADYAFTPDWLAAEKRNDEWYHNMSSVKEAGVAEITFQLEFDDEVGFHAIRKIYDYARNLDQSPFALMVSFTHPHDPYVARSEWWDLYDHDAIDMPSLVLGSAPADSHSRRLIAGMQADVDAPTERDVRNSRHAYYANVSYVDDWLGKIVNALTKTQLLDNTIVFFTADHGEMLGERGLWYKMNFFEQAARVPLVAAGPGIVPSSIPNSCSTTDLLPTLIELATNGTDRAPEITQPIDGRSLQPLLTGSGSDDDCAVSQYAAECTAHPMIMIRRGNYKFIHCDSDEPMLFNVEEDPQELENLIDNEDYREITDSFANEIRERWDSERIREDIILDQQARLLIHEATKNGTSISWDFQPQRNAAEEYVRTNRTIDYMAASRRFPN